MNNLWILAQADQDSPATVGSEPVSEEGQATTVVPGDTNTPAARPKPQGILGQPLILFGLMAVVMYFILFRGPRKKQQKHKQMMQSLKKNDRVRTIGGILGTIVDIKDDEITLKIDESNNTKIKVTTSAIGTTLSRE